MTLREQLLLELRTQNELVQKEIKELEEQISFEAFAITTLNSGALAGVARSACESRKNAAITKRDRIKQQNSWISEMLSKYR